MGDFSTPDGKSSESSAVVQILYEGDPGARRIREGDRISRAASNARKGGQTGTHGKSGTGYHSGGIRKEHGRPKRPRMSGSLRRFVSQREAEKLRDDADGRRYNPPVITNYPANRVQTRGQNQREQQLVQQRLSSVRDSGSGVQEAPRRISESSMLLLAWMGLQKARREEEEEGSKLDEASSDESMNDVGATTGTHTARIVQTTPATNQGSLSPEEILRRYYESMRIVPPGGGGRPGSALSHDEHLKLLQASSRVYAAARQANQAAAPRISETERRYRAMLAQQNAAHGRPVGPEPGDVDMINGGGSAPITRPVSPPVSDVDENDLYSGEVAGSQDWADYQAFLEWRGLQPGAPPLAGPMPLDVKKFLCFAARETRVGPAAGISTAQKKHIIWARRRGARKGRIEMSDAMTEYLQWSDIPFQHIQPTDPMFQPPPAPESGNATQPGSWLSS
ncbi:hypothetical protein QBC35DRAFT_503305 [Podospora australis]|uniref:Uncharacterized protein n=1 Tax=Podospora australis TaxID=1536484 RepID=A0AAN7AH68_9PEZI|nr:hypothetical protein QBC35DRAFT_503305 [Podospora australis]